MTATFANALGRVESSRLIIVLQPLRDECVCCVCVRLLYFITVVVGVKPIHKHEITQT